MDKREKGIEDADRFVHMVAKKQGWEVNNNKDFLSTVVKGLATTHNRVGYYLCPCRDGAGERSADKDIICPCVYNRMDQKEFGHCFCGLFFDPEYQNNNGEFKQIPDRRPDELYD